LAIVLIIVIAVAAFWLWSVNGAKKAKSRFLTAFVRAVQDQVRNTPRDPSWYLDTHMKELVEQALASVPSRSSPFDPDVVQEWLEASLTRDDIFTFMNHAEAVGFTPAEQVALAPDAAFAFLQQDVIKGLTILDKMILLRLVAAAKSCNGQTILTLKEFSYPLVHNLFVSFGGKDDRDEELDWGPMYLSCDFPFRDGTFPASLSLSDDPKSSPEILIFDIKPQRATAQRYYR
jgi:hypothetical protein